VLTKNGKGKKSKVKTKRKIANKMKKCEKTSEKRLLCGIDLAQKAALE